MKKYVILVKEGFKSQVFEVRNLKELYNKIDSGHYHILPIRGLRAIKITRENIQEVVQY